jgi:hypothetical protein
MAVVVDDPAAIVLGSALDAGAQPDPARAAPASDGSAQVLAAGLGDDAGWLPGAGAGLLGLLGISVVSIAVTTVRRRHGRRLATGRIAARSALIGRPSDATRDATPY